MEELILPKNISVGIYDSRLAVKNKDITDNRLTMSFEIELPAERGGISYINGDSFHITPDTVICVKPGQLRHTKLPFKCYFLHMDIDSGILYDVLTDTPDYFIAKDTDKYKKIFDSLFEYYNSAAAWDNIILYSLILELVHTIGADCSHLTAKKGLKYANTEFMETALKFMENHLSSGLTLNDIAKQVSLSPIYFHNTFKAITGKTPHQYLDEIRFKKAAKLLVSTNMKLSQIAYECGFSSQAYFNCAFKKYMGITPREYMRKIFERYR